MTNVAMPYIPAPWFRVLRDPLLPERLLAKLWRAKTGRTLRTTDGKSLKVIYPGRPAPGHGPDFRDAVIELDGNRIAGPVELHRTSNDWYVHGHHRDSAYDNVVLHVVAGARETPSVERRRQATVAGATPATPDTLPTVALSPDELAAGGTLLMDLAAMSTHDLREELRHAGLRRFETRVVELQGEIDRRGSDQMMLSAIMDGLGYSENREPFAELSRRLPFALFRAATATVAPAQREALARELLLSASGLERPSERWRSLIGTAPMDRSLWRVSGVRPTNRPLPRLLALAAYVTKSLETGVVGWVQGGLAEGASAIVETLTVHESGAARVGTARAREIVINGVLPGLAAHARKMSNDRLRTAARLAYERFPALQENTLTKEATSLLGGAAPGRLTACEQQGLIQVYREALANAAIQAT